MRMIFVYLNVARMYRARWHRQQHEKLMAKVADHLLWVEELE